MKGNPRPMKNMRPSKKNRNAADRFREEHEATYESHGTAAPSHDVDAHNSGYPKMRDELKRRRSTAKPTVPVVSVKRRRVVKEMMCDYCPHCQRLKADTKMKPRMRRTIGGNGKKKVTHPRVTKRTRKYASTRKTKFNNFNNLRSITSGADGELPERNSNSAPASHGTKSVISSAVSDNSFWSDSVKTDPSVLVMSRGCQSYNYLTVGTSKQAKESQETRPNSDPAVKPGGSKSDVVSRNPDTSENTLSSYNSNMSLDHEPMVSN